MNEWMNEFSCKSSFLQTARATQRSSSLSYHCLSTLEADAALHAVAAPGTVLCGVVIQDLAVERLQGKLTCTHSQKKTDC